MRIDHRIVSGPLFALSFAVACGDSESTLGRKGSGGSDSGAAAGGSSAGGAAGNATGGAGGRSTGTGGKSGTGGSSGSTANGGSSGAAGNDASAGGASGDGGPTADGSAAGGSAGAGGSAAGGAGGGAAGGAGGRGTGGVPTGGAGGRGTGGGTVGTACQRLGACCDTVQPTALRPSCNQYATLGDQTQCGALLGIYCAGVDAGPPPPVPDAANACSALSACCPQTGAQQASCEQTATLGNPGLCATILSLLCP